MALPEHTKANINVMTLVGCMTTALLLKLNGIFAVHKPPGITSAKFLDMVKAHLLGLCGIDAKKHHAHKLIKMGHGGTLDPMAEGVLVVGVGEGCKRLSSYLSGTKQYRFELTLGKHYDTYDITGKCLEEAPFEHVTRNQVEDILPRFTGEIMQKPPAFSALRIDGRRAYDIARKHSKKSDSTEPAVDLQARPITINTLTLDRFELPAVECTADVGGGCYVRSLCVDMAAALNTKGAMSKLVRVKQGQFTLTDCLHLADLTDLERVRSVMH